MTKFKELRELLIDPNRWCKYSNAQNAHHLAVRYNDSSACRWCLSGATFKLNMNYCQIGLISHMATEYIMNDPYLSQSFLSFKYLPDPISFLNDNTDHETVIKLIDKTIEKQKTLWL